MTPLHSQSDFIRGNLEAARLFWRNTGGIERIYKLGGLPIRVRLIGGSIEQVVGHVLAHSLQPAADDMIASTIYAVDSAMTGFPEPPPDWPFEVDTADGNLRTCWKPELGLAMSSDESRGIWHLMDLEAMEGLYWATNGSNLPGWEYGSPPAPARRAERIAYRQSAEPGHCRTSTDTTC